MRPWCDSTQGDVAQQESDGPSVSFEDVGRSRCRRRPEPGPGACSRTCAPCSPGTTSTGKRGQMLVDEYLRARTDARARTSASCSATSSPCSPPSPTSASSRATGRPTRRSRPRSRCTARASTSTPTCTPSTSSRRACRTRSGRGWPVPCATTASTDLEPRSTSWRRRSTGCSWPSSGLPTRSRSSPPCSSAGSTRATTCPRRDARPDRRGARPAGRRHPAALPGVGDLARSIRFRLFDEPLIRQAREQAYAGRPRPPRVPRRAPRRRRLRAEHIDAMVG